MLLGTTQPRGCISFSWIPAVHPNSTSECSESLTEVVIASMIFGLVSLQLLHLELQQYSGSSWRKQKQIKETGGGTAKETSKHPWRPCGFFGVDLKKNFFSLCNCYARTEDPQMWFWLMMCVFFFPAKSHQSHACAPPFEGFLESFKILTTLVRLVQCLSEGVDLHDSSIEAQKSDSASLSCFVNGAAFPEVMFFFMILRDSSMSELFFSNFLCW